MNELKTYSFSARLIHWIMAIMILSMLFLGVSMIQSLSIWQSAALSIHKSFGVLILVLVGVRLINRILFKTPSLPSDLPKFQAVAGHLTHILLYIAMLLMPISGWFMQSSAGLEVSFFGLFSLPNFITQDIKLYSIFRELHGIVAWMFFGLILLHISAALYHKLIRHDGVFDSMGFGGKK